MNADLLKRPLRKKAGQHKAIRAQGYPYVIALFLEPWDLSAEEVVEAWIGPETVVVDTQHMEVVEQRRDPKGIHFLGNQIRHRSVSGTLTSPNLGRKRRKTRPAAWYIQNPYAAQSLPTDLFPVEASYVLTERNGQAWRMGWVRKRSEPEAANKPEQDPKS